VFVWVSVYKACEKEGKEKNPCIKHHTQNIWNDAIIHLHYFPPKLTGGWEVATSTSTHMTKNKENGDKIKIGLTD
jgi:hypothetical protein